jgi:hypothetical protein
MNRNLPGGRPLLRPGLEPDRVLHLAPRILSHVEPAIRGRKTASETLIRILVPSRATPTPGATSNDSEKTLAYLPAMTASSNPTDNAMILYERLPRNSSLFDGCVIAR